MVWGWSVCHINHLTGNLVMASNGAQRAKWDPISLLAGPCLRVGEVACWAYLPCRISFFTLARPSVVVGPRWGANWVVWLPVGSPDKRWLCEGIAMIDCSGRSHWWGTRVIGVTTRALTSVLCLFWWPRARPWLSLAPFVATTTTTTETPTTGKEIDWSQSRLSPGRTRSTLTHHHRWLTRTVEDNTAPRMVEVDVHGLFLNKHCISTHYT